MKKKSTTANSALIWGIYARFGKKDGRMFATHYFTKLYLHRLHNCVPMNRHLTISLEVQIPRKSIY